MSGLIVAFLLLRTIVPSVQCSTVHSGFLLPSLKLDNRAQPNIQLIGVPRGKYLIAKDNI